MTRYERCDCCGISEGAWDDLSTRAFQAERERDRLRGIVEAVRGCCRDMRRNANLDDAPEVEDALEEIETLTEEA